MGFWGKKFFENDTSCDIRDQIMGFNAHENNEKEVIDKAYKFIDEYDLCDNDKEIAIIAASISLLDIGVVCNELICSALSILSDNIYIQKLFSEKDIERIKIRLKNKKTKKNNDEIIKKIIDSNPWSCGDIIAYRMPKKSRFKGKYLLFQKIDNTEPRVQFFKLLLDELPNSTECISNIISNSFILPTVSKLQFTDLPYNENHPMPEWYYNLRMNALIHIDENNYLNVENFFTLCNLPIFTRYNCDFSWDTVFSFRYDQKYIDDLLNDWLDMDDELYLKTVEKYAHLM